MRRTFPPEAALALVAFVWGVNFTVVKQALEDFEPSVLMALRFVVASMAFALVLWWRGGLGRPTTRDWWALILLGLVGNTLYQLCFVHGMVRTTPANASLLVLATPVLVAVISQLQGKETLTERLGAGLLLAISGVGLIVWASGASLTAGSRTGDLLILAGAFCWTLYTLGVRDLKASITPLQVTALTLFTGTPGLVLAGLPGLAQQNWARIRPIAWLEMIFSALVAVVFAYIVWNQSVRRVGANRTVIFNCAVPLVATMTAWAVRGERPSLAQMVGAVLIVTGVLLTQRAPTPTASSTQVLSQPGSVEPQ